MGRHTHTQALRELCVQQSECLELERGSPRKVTASLVCACAHVAESRTASLLDVERCCAVACFARKAGSEACFRARPKGVGVACARASGLRAHEYVCDYLGEVYPAQRWLEKLACITLARRSALTAAVADATPPPECFHNMALERPQSDPRGYALCFIDAGGGLCNFASSLSHSCDGNVVSSVF